MNNLSHPCPSNRVKLTTSNVFELLDNQRKAFTLCTGIIDNCFLSSGSNTPPKKVIIIQGPPGSGKSVIAARIWASLVTNPRLPSGDVVFTTTSMSQNSNWSELFDKVTGLNAASGVVRKATHCCPITTQRLGVLRKRYGTDFLAEASEWRKNLSTLAATGEKWRDGAQDEQNLVSIVDEAHALINPEYPEGRGQFGFVTTLGPQAYHIIRSSLLSVLLLDPLQGFRQRENTSIEQIIAWSKELGAGMPEIISLDGMQFRCAGSKEYVSWIESVLDGKDAKENQILSRTWHKSPATKSNIISADFSQFKQVVAEARTTEYSVHSNEEANIGMDFRIFDNPEEWENQLRRRVAQNYSVRILASYARKWKTEGAANPHQLAPELMDFHEPYFVNDKKRYWSRIWNYVPNKSDYTLFVTGHQQGFICSDPLCEVGCAYAVRGFDYDYVGIYWLNDCVWRDGHWVVDPEVVEERGFKDLASAARRELTQSRHGPAMHELRKRVIQAYRILFTRALKGVYVWVPDEQTRKYLSSSLPPKM